MKVQQVNRFHPVELLLVAFSFFFLLETVHSFLIPVSPKGPLLQEHQRNIWKGIDPSLSLFNGKKPKEDDTGGEVIFCIPAKKVKVGALRFLIQIYIVAEQNQHQQNTWLTKEGDTSGQIQIYFADGTGMVTFDLQEYNIRAIRYGENPSLQYRLQESVLLHGVLDELENVAFGTQDIEEEKRLLRVEDTSAIETARKTLPAKPA